MSSLPLSEGKCKPQPSNSVHKANLLGTAQIHWPQPNICNQLLHRLASLAIRPTIEEVGTSSFKLWIGKVFPTKRVEGPKDASVRRILLEGGEAVHCATPHTIRRVDNDAPIQLIGILRDHRIHSRTRYSHHHHIWIAG